MSASSNRAERWRTPLAAALPGWLPDFLPGQRWFGAKARRIVSARLADAAWLRGGESPCALVVAEVGYADGGTESYSLLLALRREPAGLPVLGRLEAAGETRHVVEAAAHPADAIVLLRHLGEEHDLATAGGGALRFADLPPEREGALAARELRARMVRPLGVEQSNTSLKVGSRHVFKLLRRLESGESAELETMRFLTRRTSFRAAPGLRGSLTWAPAAGPAVTVGVLQDRIANLGDGWKWLLAQLREILALRANPEPLVGEVFSLGALTAEFHAAMACDPHTPAFAPEPASAADAAGWRESLLDRAGRVFAHLAEASGGMAEPARGLSESLLRLRPRLDAVAAPPPVTGAGGFHKIRVHGDYHLGQTLKTAQGFVLIDFEGEPARPLAERRRRHCALKDVAGMLRSFDYGIGAARAEFPEVAPAAGPPLAESFLRGYESRALEGDALFLPRDAAARAAWAAFFELDKALYEIEYEMQNRPAWLPLPLAGTLRILEGAEV